MASVLVSVSIYRLKYEEARFATRSVSMPEPPETLLPKTCRLIQEGIEQGLHLGMQVYISSDGNELANFAIGVNAEGQSLESDVLCAWLSSGKPLTAVALMQFVERGKFRLEDRVAAIIPEFAVKGKEDVTVFHLLTHTGGLRPVVSGWPRKSWEEIIAKITATSLRMDWEPGQTAAYDPGLSWMVLGEILCRIDGRPIDEIVRQDVLEPLGMSDCWMAVPEHLHAAYGNRIGMLYNIVDQEFQPTRGHEVEYCGAPSPGGSMRGPISQLGLFYEMLLRGGLTEDGRQFLSAESVEAMTSRQREGKFDRTFQHQLDFGLGLMINSNQYGVETVPYGFGRYASPNAFGHGGAQSSIAFADPEHQLVVAVAANGCPGEEQHNQRFRELNSAIYEDLGLITSSHKN